MRKGVRQWLSLGIPAKKLVLGLPWYGYDYQCEGPDASTPAAADVDLCVLKPMEFQNVSCSDAVGAQKCYWEIMASELMGTMRGTLGVMVSCVTTAKGISNYCMCSVGHNMLRYRACMAVQMSVAGQNI